MLEELPTGKHKLSGIDSYSRHTDNIFASSSISGYYIIIDNDVYAFEEDPDDGYRSYGSAFLAVGLRPKDIKNRFSPQDVIITKIDTRDKKQFYQIEDAITHKIILEVGTDYYENWYPCAIFNYHPENMYINSPEYPGKHMTAVDNSSKAQVESVPEWQITTTEGNCNFVVDYTIKVPNLIYVEKKC